ncbi:MAG: hypothetical protein P0116_04970 [Candidatus Nitrosocosmicus sp.]|nr:hypothetical protein [Candidatus Nitrosocosmicus sp.]
MVFRDQIAKNNHIAYGSVYNIVQETRQGDIPDIDLLRQLSLSLKRDGWEPSQFARSMRLNKLLDNLDMSEEQIEDFLEQLSVFFHMNDVEDIQNFLFQFESVSDFVKNLGVSIYDIEEYIANKQAELYSLNHELGQIKEQIDKKRCYFVELIRYCAIYGGAHVYRN